MTEWKQDKKWSDRFLSEIKRILGENLISEPPIEEDVERNTDLITLRLDVVRIGCRVRKHAYLDKYGDEFTIRGKRLSNATTELAKIMEGWGDYFLYGFSDAHETRLEKWILGDLNAFRQYFAQHFMGNKGEMLGNEERNKDSSSSFYAFRYDDIPGFVVAKHPSWKAGRF